MAAMPTALAARRILKIESTIAPVFMRSSVAQADAFLRTLFENMRQAKFCGTMRIASLVRQPCCYIHRCRFNLPGN
jgi:hypothetical protein